MWKVASYCALLLLCVGASLLPCHAKTLNPTEKSESFAAFSLAETEACMSWQGNPVKDTIPKDHTQLAIHHIDPSTGTPLPSSIYSLDDDRPEARNETKCCGGLSCKFLDGVCCPGSSHCCPRGYLCNTDTDPPSCEDDMQDVNKHRIFKRRVSRIRILKGDGTVVSDTGEPRQTNDPNANSAAKESSELDPKENKNSTSNTTAAMNKAEKAAEEADKLEMKAEESQAAAEKRKFSQNTYENLDYARGRITNKDYAGTAWPPMSAYRPDGSAGGFVANEQRDWSGHGLIRNGTSNLVVNEEQCRDQCDDLEECRVAIFHRSNGECWLDSTIGSMPQPCARLNGRRNCVSYVKKMSTIDMGNEYGATSTLDINWVVRDQENWNVASADVKEEGGRLLRNGKYNRVDNEFECRKQCADLAYCRVALFIKNTGECWLSSKVASKGGRCALRGRIRSCISSIKKSTKHTDGDQSVAKDSNYTHTVIPPSDSRPIKLTVNIPGDAVESKQSTGQDGFSHTIMNKGDSRPINVAMNVNQPEDK